jgi:CheY-like chemotaxis protein
MQDLCKALGGDLFLSDECTSGSCFVIELTGGTSQHGIKNESSLALIAKLETKLPESMRVLLVDDSVSASKLLTRRLLVARGNMTVIRALNGEEALVLCRHAGCAFDLIVMDENMQSTGGLLLGHEVVREMRSHLGLHRTVIIACTGNAVSCREDFMTAGADDVWSKPTPDINEMVATISEHRCKRLGEVTCQLRCAISVAIIDDSIVNSKLLVRRISMYATPTH